jgi:rfaE bifunctional protein kinase chain/domain
MNRGPLVVIGDALLDRDLLGRSGRLSPDAGVPVVDGIRERCRPGGAGLAALLAARDGREVVLVTALGGDAAADRLRTLLGAELDVAALPWTGPTTQKVRIEADGEPLLRMDFGDGAPDAAVGPLTEVARRAIAGAGAVLIADYGRGVAAERGVRAALAARTGQVPVVWDPHPRGAPPVPGVTVATPNLGEATRFAGADHEADASDVARARRCAAALRTAWAARALAVTLGRRGALLATTDDPALLLRPPGVHDGDPCGAGDRFSASLAGRLLDGAPLPAAVAAAVATASAYVAGGGPADLYPAGPPGDDPLDGAPVVWSAS